MLTDLKTLTHCKLGEDECRSVDEWTAFAKPYLED